MNHLDHIQYRISAKGYMNLIPSRRFSHFSKGASRNQIWFQPIQPVANLPAIAGGGGWDFRRVECCVCRRCHQRYRNVFGSPVLYHFI